MDVWYGSIKTKVIWTLSSKHRELSIVVLFILNLFFHNFNIKELLPNKKANIVLCIFKFQPVVRYNLCPPPRWNMCNMFPSCPIAQHPPLPLHPPSSPFSISRAIDCEVAGGDRDDIRNKLSAGGREETNLHWTWHFTFCRLYLHAFAFAWPCSVASKWNAKKNICIKRQMNLSCQHSPRYISWEVDASMNLKM